MLVKRKMRTKLLGIAGTIGLCAAMVGTYLAVPASAEETRKLPLSAVVGNVSDGVTVSTAKTFTVPGVQVANEKDEAGNVTSWKSSTINALALTPVSDTQEWSAEINATFTGNTSISYAVGMYDNATSNGAANAFTVKNADGETVANFVIANYRNIGYHSYNSAYVYNAAEEKYTTCQSKWMGSYNTSIYETTEPNVALTPSATGRLGFSNLHEFVTYIAPSHSPSWQEKSNLSEGDGTGTVYFEYADGVLSVKTSTYKVNGRDDHAEKSGNGQILTMGKINADLSKGYTITVGSAPAVGEYTYASTAMYITKINEFSTAAAEAEAAETKKISYYNETDDGKIYVSSGEKLARFDFITEEILTDENGKTLTVGNAVEKFEFDGNKAFTAEEEISVSHGGVSKNYTVVPSFATVKSTDLFVSNSTVTAAQSSGVVATGVKVDSKTNLQTEIGGTFYGNSSISYYIYNTGIIKNAGHALTLVNAVGESVLTIVSFPYIWQVSGAANYMYNHISKEYSVAQADGTSKIVTDYTGAESGAGHLPNFQLNNGKFNNWGEYDVANSVLTCKFEYNETEKTLTAKINRERKADVEEETYLTIGSVNIDLSEGYTIRSGNACDLTAETGNIEGKFTSGANHVYFTAINGISLAGTTAQTTAVNEKIVAQNANVDENGVVVLNKGETPVFESQSTYALGSLQIAAASAVKTRVYGSISEFGDTAVVTAIDAVGRKDFDVRVKTLSESIANSGMIAGASIRAAEPYGIRFAMNIGESDYALIANEVGEGKAYLSVKYGMMILPYSYLSKYGELTEENLFGENAKYTWKGKGQENGTQIMLRYSENALTADEVHGGYTLMYSNVGLEGKWITEKFVGAGFIEFTKADGTKEYKIFTRHENYDENNAESVKNSCVRSCYEVAVAAYEDAETSQILKDYLYEHYLKNNGYTPKEGN